MAKIYKSGSCKTAIFSSKLFQSSTRKGKIMAALDNPINAELVKQLDEYIGDEYKPKPVREEPKQTMKKQTSNSEQGMNNSDSSSTSRIAHNNGSSLSEKYGDDLDAEGAAAFDASQVSRTAESEEDTSAESSVKIEKPYVQADTIITKPFVENNVTLSGLAGELKGTLNARENTAGVVRTSIKNNEVWIYYNDDINLNNVMSPVIDVLNAANYQYLIFNRLARTDNAIVFTVNCNDTLNTMESVKNET